jgi:hypothetical protein
MRISSLPVQNKRCELSQLVQSVEIQHLRQFYELDNINSTVAALKVRKPSLALPKGLCDLSLGQPRLFAFVFDEFDKGVISLGSYRLFQKKCPVARWGTSNIPKNTIPKK